MKITRVYTTSGQDPLASIDFEFRTSEIKQPDGTVIFSMENVEVPKHWSQIATDILAQKYLRKAGVPTITVIQEFTDIKTSEPSNWPIWLRPSIPHPESEFTSETSAKQVFHRLAGCWTFWGWIEGYFDSEENAKAFYDELVYMLAMQIFAPNSPQWFNTGLHWAYGITGKAQGHYYFDKKQGTVVKSEDAYSRPQPHACFIQGIEDHLVAKNGIMDTWVKEARLFKYGSGSGINFSNLRGNGEPLEGGGKSSGLMSWLKIGDVSAGGIRSGGTTRRAAKMVIVDIDHPDIEEFIDWKVKEEQKVAALITGSKINRWHLNKIVKLYFERFDEEKIDSRFYSKRDDQKYQNAISDARQACVPEHYIQRVIQLAEQGIKELDFDEFTSDWQGEAYKTVSGQNSNNSVSVTNAFMEAVEKDGSYNLKYKTQVNKEGSVFSAAVKTVSAKKLWDKICYSAWACADPGLFFYNTVNDWNTVSNDSDIKGCNPCAEYIFLDDTACNLASLNLVKFYDSKYFDFEKLEHAASLITVVLDISVSMAQFPSSEIALGSYNYRPLGLGYANLGALLMRMAIAYDSVEALRWTGLITATMHLTAYKISALLAKDLGAFPRYEANKEPMLNVISKHMEALAKFGGVIGAQLRREAVELKFFSTTHGFRNAFVTCIAPTGTIGLVMDCDTTGIEPDYALVKYKKLAGGGNLTIVNQSVEPALERLGYSTSAIKKIVEYLLVNMTIEGAPYLEQKDYPIFDCATKCGAKGTRFIEYNAHLNILAAAQPFLSGSSSKTINMPHTATIEDVRLVYKKAWELGLKAIALYRDSSKLSQPLSSIISEPVEDTQQEVISKTVEYEFSKDNIEALQKVFKIASGETKVPSKTSFRRKLPTRRSGYTQKAEIAGHNIYIRTGEYPDGSLGEIFIDMYKEGVAIRSLLNCFSIAVSLGLQYGVPLQKFISMFAFTKFEPSGAVKDHSRIKLASSIIDYVFRDLAIHYLKQESLAHTTISEGTALNISAEIEPVISSFLDTPVTSKERGYTGDMCSECFNLTMVRNGTCLKCMSCGSTTGCS